MTDLESLRNQLRTFAADRDWDQFHSPKNLAAAKAKIILNAEKYPVQPVEKARGSSKKYTALLRGIRARYQARRIGRFLPPAMR